ncbi:nucleotidyltransferase domain-containing protein [Candidatus Bathyarchaeota archaeon]|nr:nucleotidyltransferase domain-containing protein [Candidatus Bathyarchaeota archaeon]MBS7614044.1 nucleotidyltransferase domain-containing protein [Candidatus Bathyarchaeota archaeon]
MQIDKDVKLLKYRLKSLKASCVKAVIMFGSRARGETKEKSDVDLLILHENCRIEDPVLRRRHLYNIIQEAVGNVFESITVIDMALEHFLKPLEINSLLLNIYWDAIVIYDETGNLQEFLTQIKERIAKSGLKRVKDGKAYRWILPEPMKEVKIL